MSITTATDAFRKHLIEMRKPNAIRGLPTGIPDLDRLLGGGLGDGEVMTVFARTSIGKTSVLLDMIRGGCEHLLDTKDARTIVLVSAEMPGRAIVQRLVAGLLDVPSYKLPYTKEETIKEALDYIETWPLAIYDQRNPSVDDVKEYLTSVSGGWKPGAGRSPFAEIVVDHLGKLTVPGVYEIYPKTSQLADRLFNMAGYYKCPVIQAAQVNRNVESRIARGKDGSIDVSMTRPGPSDVEGSGKIEQNSDVMVAISRDEHYLAIHEQRKEEASVINLTVVKNRNGGTGNVAGQFIPEMTKIIWPGKIAAALPSARKAQAKAAAKTALEAARSTPASALAEAAS